MGKGGLCTVTEPTHTHAHSPYFENWGWGQVVPDGYGIAYMALPAHIHLNVVSECMGSRRLLAAACTALDDMMRLARSQGKGSEADAAPRARL